MKSARQHLRLLAPQRGLSLIELMVAMVIGCFLILGVTQIFISNQRTYLFQQGQVGNQENGRFALALLAQELSKAGYRSNPTKPFAGETTQGCAFAENASVIALSPTSLCLRYQASNRTDVNCQGTVAASQASISAPYLQANPVIVEKIEFDQGTNSITCTVSSSTMPLVTGVKDIRFDYGAGTDAKTVTTFSAAPAGVIGAVRYTILMQSDGTTNLRDTTDVSPALTDWNGRYGTTYNDTKSIYQIVQGTIMLRNQMP